MEELVARVRALMRRPPQLQRLIPTYLGLQVQPKAQRLKTSCADSENFVKMWRHMSDTPFIH
jgi:hypothetical protein